MDALDMFVEERLQGNAYHRTVLILTALLNAVISSLNMSCPLVWPVLQAQYNLTTNQISLLGSAYAVGSIIGSFVYMNLSLRYGRSALLKANVFLQILMGSASLICDGYFAFVLFWGLNGAFLNAFFNIYSVYALETSPTKTRGRWSMLINMFGSLGVITTVYLYPLYVNSSDTGSWKYPFLSATFLLAVLLVPILCTFKETFRFLLSKAKLSRFVKTFKEIAKINAIFAKSDESNFDVSESEVKALAEKLSNSNKATTSHHCLKALLSRKYLMITLVLVLISTCLINIYNGLNIILPYWFKTDTDQPGNNFMVVTFSAEILAEVAGWGLIDYSLVGRRKGLQIFALLMAIVCSGSYFCEAKQSLVVFMFAIRCLVVLAMIFVAIYIVELYPTWLRGYAYCMITGLYSIAAIPLSYIVLNLFNWKPYAVLVFFWINAMAYLGGTALLWKDRTGKSLDLSLSFVETSNN